jgi:Fur family ferric uptake transcriptional regulator
MACGAHLEQELRRSGIRVTAQRSVILETVAHLSRHSSAQEVYERARLRLPGLNPATVYRTLEALHRAGILDQLAASEAPLRFSLRDPSKPHHHLVCRRCGKSAELDPERLRALSLTLTRSVGFVLDRDHQTLTGLCKDCRRSGWR